MVALRSTPEVTFRRTGQIQIDLQLPTTCVTVNLFSLVPILLFDERSAE
jgi:hypothetical protein